MLKQYPSFPYIQRVEQIKNWQQVMIIFVQLRLTGKSIKSRYIDCLLQVHQDIGPYSVIAPQISMLNARPEDNILAQKLPLFIMQQRIDFASENDLVNLVLMLTEKDYSLYLAMLLQVVGRSPDGNILGSLSNLLRFPILRRSYIVTN